MDELDLPAAPGLVVDDAHGNLVATVTKIPIIADRPESALQRFGTAPGVLIKAPPVNRGLLNPLITGAAGSDSENLKKELAPKSLLRVPASRLLTYVGLERGV